MSPTAKNFIQSDHKISLRCHHTIGANANEEMPNLKHAKETGSKAIRDFLISIKEHPQTMVDVYKRQILRYGL